MRRAVEGNKGIRDVADLPNNAVQGYGLYASPDAMQTPEFGDVLIEFEIPLEAYYSLYDTLENSIKKIRGNQLGVVYPYRPSVSGDKAVVLRWDSSAHPLALPIIPGSVRVYPNTISGWRGDNLISTLDELRKKGANKSGNPARDFMDRYGHHLGLFHMTPATGKTDDQLKDILVHSFIKDQLAELKKRPKWVEDGLVRLRRAADSDPVINGLTYKSIYFNKEKIDDPRYFGDAMMIAFRDIMGDSLWNLPFLIRFAKAMEMVPEAFEPKSVPDLRREIVNQRVPAATRQSLEESLKQAQRDWVEVVEYWKKNNLDAFVERVSQ
jgi:hypothetical protein